MLYPRGLFVHACRKSLNWAAGAGAAAPPDKPLLRVEPDGSWPKR